jgi:DNA-binding PadR family transcriptional regulator
MDQAGWLASSWGQSETNRKARYYTLTKAGRRQLQAEAASWRRTSALMAKFIESV